MTVKLINHDRGNEREFDTRAEAEEKKQDMVSLGAPPAELEIVADGDELPDDEPVPGVDVCVHCDSEIDDGHCPDCDTADTAEADAGTTVETEPVDHGAVDTEPADLPDDPNLTDDPFSWMPGDFVDQIDGTPTINRRGYAALGRKFGISAPSIDVAVGPEETGHEYARVQATVVDDDGREYQNHGSAHVDRGDDPTLLLELATTRARKRALAGATGIGLIAVEELKNEL
jgi:hypothetical protein